MYVTHITAFSCWSRFLIILQCVAVCLAVPLHQDSTIHVCNSVVRHWRKITLTKIKLTNCNFFKVRTCIRHPWQWKKNKKTFLFNNLFISIFKTVHILLRDTAFYTGYVKDARVKKWHLQLNLSFEGLYRFLDPKFKIFSRLFCMSSHHEL